jgi:hypothetical protein
MSSRSSDLVRFFDRCHHRFFNQNMFPMIKRLENNRLVLAWVSDN